MKKLASLVVAVAAFSLCLADDEAKYIILDQRPPAWSVFPPFVNVEALTPIIPKGYGLKIIMEDPAGVDGECSNRQIEGCKNTCGARKMLSVGCDVQYEWQPDGSCKRIVTCDCASPMSPRIAGSQVRVTTIKMEDPTP